MYVYFPSCNFTKMRPGTAAKLRKLLSERMPVAGCCRFDKNEYAGGEVGLYHCQACRETLDGRLPLMSVYEYFDADGDFALPDYSGLTVGVQDCWRDREHPEVGRAVRSLLKKMNISVREPEESGQASVFCGNLHFEPKKPENAALLAQYPRKRIFEMPREVEEALMREQVEKFGTEYIVTCCNRCTLGIEAGGGKAIHILELVMGDFPR